MRYCIVKGTLILMFISTLAMAQKNPNDITGKWYAEELDKSTIEIKKVSQDLYVGVVIESDEPTMLDSRILYDFRKDDDSNSYSGRIYSVKRDMEIDGEIEMLTANKILVTGRKLFFSKSFEWVRFER